MLHIPNAPASIASTLPPPGRALAMRTLLAIAAAVALLLGIAGAAVWQSAFNDTALGTATIMRQQRNASTDLLKAALDAETAQRGFLLITDPAGLALFNQSERAVPGLLDQVAAAWPGDPRLAVLRQVVTAKFAELRQTVDLVQNGDRDGALAIVRTNAGSTNMGSIRVIVAELNAEMDQRLAEQVDLQRRGSLMLVGIDVTGLLMVLALAGLIGLGLRDYYRTLHEAHARTAAAYASVAENNAMLDEAVRRRTAALTEANAEIQRFAYIVSHDLRAPLVNIMGFTSELDQAAAALSRHVLATETPDDVRAAVAEDIPEALRFIKSSTQKMDRLINAILRLSREGRRVLAPERLDMRGLLAGLAETMQHQANSQDAVVEVGPAPDLVADRLAVEQVFGNLIENALKYRQPGRPGRIRVSGRSDDSTRQMISFEVSDNGRGIAARDFERVFELFRRAGDQNVPGEGIGLAHVRALVRRLGGSVDCSSELGVGSVFIVRLPAVAISKRDISV